MGTFKFDKRIIVDHLRYELNTISKFKEPFKFITKTLEDLGHSITFAPDIDLNQIKEQEGKNYHWSVIKHDKGAVLIRRYRNHLTIYTKTDKSREVGEGDDKRMYHDTEYGAFILKTNFEKFGDKQDYMMDTYYDAPFTSLNQVIQELIPVLIDKGAHWVYYMDSLDDNKHIEIESIFDNNNIQSIDQFCFCMEEIDQIHMSLFAENTMMKKLQELKAKEGEHLTKRYKIKEVRAELKDCYHGVGINFIDTMQEDKEKWDDVYSLACYRFDEVFQEHLSLCDGEYYVDGGEFEVGKPCRYKPKEEGKPTRWVYFKDTFNKEEFIPLKKF
jgi:hypothetical protein